MCAPRVAAGQTAACSSWNPLLFKYFMFNPFHEGGVGGWVVVVVVVVEGGSLIFIFECGWGGREDLSGSDPFNPPEVDIISFPFSHFISLALSSFCCFLYCTVSRTPSFTQNYSVTVCCELDSDWKECRLVSIKLDSLVFLQLLDLFYIFHCLAKRLHGA